jgi:gliding motility-associated-like protein
MKPLTIPCLVGLLFTLWCNFAVAQPALLMSTNPTTCRGSQGSITFDGLTPNTSYQISYTEAGTTRGPVTLVSNGSGILSIPGLTAGLYTNFIFSKSGSTEVVTTGVVLSDPIFIPTFNTIPPFCAGDPSPVLPTTSNNGLSGTWSPAVVDNQNTGSYTFTPAAGTCGIPVTIMVTVTPKKVPVFSFGTGLTICGSGTVPLLSNTSLNGITGTWNPAVVDPNNSGTYVFTPSSSGCVTGTTFTVVVNPNITPTFPFGTSAVICDGDAVPTLPNTSTNGITGTWNPAVVNNKTSGIYVFTPDAGQCAVPTVFSLTVNPIITPVFNIGPTVSICDGATAPVLPATSTNGITGVWKPAVVSNTTSGTYTFTPTSDPCAPPVSITVTVNPIIPPSFVFGPMQSVCVNSPAPVLPAISTNAITGTWSPATIDNQHTGIYTFTPDAGQCASATTFNYEVNPIPSINSTAKDTAVYDGAVLPPYDFAISPSGNIRWTNSNPAIGLPASGTGPVPSFTAGNMTDDPITATITVTPFINGCSGATYTYKVTVLPLNKDIFVPNAFSPNGDGTNDQLFVFGNYIATVELHIFNQWGQQMVTLTSTRQGWDGKFKGSAQPVGVYVYILKAVMTDGRRVNKKGSITLVR